MRYPKGFASTPIVLMIVLVIGFAAMAYIVYQKRALDNDFGISPSFFVHHKKTPVQNETSKKAKTYINSKYHYSVQYPHDWDVSALNPDCSSSTKPILSEYETIGFLQGEDGRDCLGPEWPGTFIVYAGTTPPTHTYPGNLISLTKTNVTVDGVAAQRTDGIHDAGNEDASARIYFTELTFTKSGMYYAVVYNGEQNKLVASVQFVDFFSTFRFTDPVTNLIFYHDSAGGFSFAFPDVWSDVTDTTPVTVRGSGRDEYFSATGVVGGVRQTMKYYINPNGWGAGATNVIFSVERAAFGKFRIVKEEKVQSTEDFPTPSDMYVIRIIETNPSPQNPLYIDFVQAKTGVDTTFDDRVKKVLSTFTFTQ